MIPQVNGGRVLALSGKVQLPPTVRGYEAFYDGMPSVALVIQRLFALKLAMHCFARTEPPA